MVFSDKQKRTIDIWKEKSFIWQHLVSPLRPSRGDIEIYRLFGGESFSKKILILGATPELRDLVAESDGHTTLIDASEVMLSEMDKFLKIALPKNEIKIKLDWRDIDFPEESFDLIIGDLSWWMIPVADQKYFCKKLVFVLKNGGHFISRFRVWNQSRTMEDPYLIVKDYFSIADGDFIKESMARHTMLFHLADIVSSPADKKLDRKKTIATFISAIQTLQLQRINHNVLEKVTAFWMKKMEISYQTRDDILAILLQDDFYFETESYAQDYEDSQVYPVISFQKRVKQI